MHKALLFLFHLSIGIGRLWEPQRSSASSFAMQIPNHTYNLMMIESNSVVTTDR